MYSHIQGQMCQGTLDHVLRELNFVTLDKLNNLPSLIQNFSCLVSCVMDLLDKGRAKDSALKRLKNLSRPSLVSKIPADIAHVTCKHIFTGTINMLSLSFCLGLHFLLISGINLELILNQNKK